MEKVELAGKGAVTREPDGVVHVRWNTGVSIEEQDALKAMAAVDGLGGNQGVRVLVDISGIAGLSRTARSAFTRRGSASRIALLGSSPVDKVIANFFLALNVHACPTRYFTSSEAAMAWLHAGRGIPKATNL